MNQENNSDKNMSLPFEIIDTSNEDIEVLKDPRRTPMEVIGDAEKSLNNKVENIKTNIQNNDIYETNNDVPVIKNKDTKKKMETVLKVQIALVILWVVLTVSIYFFGYKLFEPIIPISY